MVFIFLVLLTGYLIGSLSGGYIIGRFVSGVDIRKFGSGNIGTTNVLRVLGRRYAVFVFLIDFGKGILSIYIAGLLPAQTIDPFLVRALAGFACVAGHSWPIFLKFRGGKGVATAAGVFFILTPFSFGFAVLTMLVVVGTTRYVSLGSIISSLALPFYIWMLMGTKFYTYIYLAVAVAVLVLWRHRSNVKRLIMGKENKLHASKT